MSLRSIKKIECSLMPVLDRLSYAFFIIIEFAILSRFR